MNPKQLLDVVIALAMPLVPILGDNAQGAVQRAVTIPRKQVEKACRARGMSAEETEEAIRLAVVMADAISDFAVFVASKGEIDPD